MKSLFRSVVAPWTITTQTHHRRMSTFHTTWMTFTSTRQITNTLRTRARMRRTHCRRYCRTGIAVRSLRTMPRTRWMSTRPVWTDTRIIIADGLTIRALWRAWAGTVRMDRLWHHPRRRAVARAVTGVAACRGIVVDTIIITRFRRWSSISGRRCTSGQGATSTMTRRTLWVRWVPRMRRRRISGRGQRVWTWSRPRRRSTTGERRTRSMTRLWKKVEEDVEVIDCWLITLLMLWLLGQFVDDE